MTNRVLHIVSGIGPGSSGTGRLLTQLYMESRSVSDCDIRFHYPYRPYANRRQMLRDKQFFALGLSLLRTAASWLILRIKLRWLTLFSEGNLLLFHPQTLGFKRTLRIIRAWKQRVYLFGLDNSFFCVRSYNHIFGDRQPCLRCLGGNFDAAIENGCEPFPVVDAAAYDFVRELFKLLAEGQVCVFAQNKKNAELYRRHVGKRVHVEVAGLWTADWNGLFNQPAEKASGHGYDVVFHGHFVSAKGADWMLEVARYLPNASFLFPTPLPARVHNPPRNITFRPMTWEDGLEAEVMRAKIVCVPSLWSATIEGALVKSVLFGKATARVRSESAYGDELPEGLVINLESDPMAAAHQLGRALETAWTPDRSVYKIWLINFQKENYNILSRMLHIMDRPLQHTVTDSPYSGNEV